jgi:hypothetical protein
MIEAAPDSRPVPGPDPLNHFGPKAINIGGR